MNFVAFVVLTWGGSYLVGSFIGGAVAPKCLLALQEKRPFEALSWLILAIVAGILIIHSWNTKWEEWLL
jgi:hypothetical protein